MLSVSTKRNNAAKLGRSVLFDLVGRLSHSTLTIAGLMFPSLQEFCADSVSNEGSPSVVSFLPIGGVSKCGASGSI